MVTMVPFRNERTAHRDDAGGVLASAATAEGGGRALPLSSPGPTIVDTMDDVELRVPADPAYLAVLRTATAGLATRLDLTLDEIDDLRIAVDEACSLLLAGRTHPGRTLDATFTVGGSSIVVRIYGPAETVPERTSFAWAVLGVLAGDVVTGVDEAGAWIRLTHVRGQGEL